MSRPQIDDAVVMYFAGDPVIARVVAVTEQGRRLVNPLPHRNTAPHKLDDKSGEWEKVGRFVDKKPNWFMQLFRQSEPVFVPEQWVSDD